MKVQIILSHLKNIIESESFKDRYKTKNTYFTRNRKVGFTSLSYIILNMLKKTTQLEIDNYLKKFIFKGKSFSYRKQSFSEAKQKIKFKAFKYLNNELVRKFYETTTYKKYKIYRLLAIDVTYVEVPDNTETQKYYGCATNGNKNFKIARATASKIYDLENDILVNSVLGKYTNGEISLAKENINEMLENSVLLKTI